MRYSQVFAANERPIGVSENPPDRLQGIHVLFARCFLTVDTRLRLPSPQWDKRSGRGRRHVRIPPSLLLQLRVTLSAAAHS